MRLQDLTEEYNKRHTFNALFDLYSQRDVLEKECKKSFKQSGFGSLEIFSRYITKKKLDLITLQHEISRMEYANVQLDQMREDVRVVYGDAMDVGLSAKQV